MGYSHLTTTLWLWLWLQDFGSSSLLHHPPNSARHSSVFTKWLNAFSNLKNPYLNLGFRFLYVFVFWRSTYMVTQTFLSHKLVHTVNSTSGFPNASLINVLLHVTLTVCWHFENILSFYKGVEEIWLVPTLLVLTSFPCTSPTQIILYFNLTWINA